MKLSQSFFYTLRENVKDEDSISGNLLAKAGMIKKTSSGVYMILPLGYKALKKIENIVRKEMEAIDCQELVMPALISEEVYIESKRRDNFGASMFSLKDRNNKSFVLGPTHEELFANAATAAIHSYKNLPFSLYQFQTKYRDEPRPRYGLIRVREFVMKDAYSFDTNLEQLDISYNKMFNAYKKAFDKMDLNYVIVKADTGAMGGLLSEEFQAISSIGEDTLVIQEDSGYASNLEIAGCVIEQMESEQHQKAELIETPNQKTIEEVTNFLNQDIKKFVKTLIYNIDNNLYAICVRGDHEVNETKVKKLLNANEINLATSNEVELATKAPVGFAGPVGLEIPIIIDQQITVMHNFIVGANKKDTHRINTNIEEFNYQVADIRNIQEGDMCENMAGPVIFKKGIEIGNTFKLGEKYSHAMNLYYTNPDNKLMPVIMGSYGIGIGRCLAAIVEQHNDGNKILWPKNIAPIQIAIVPINTKDEQIMKVANELYDQFKNDYDTLLDDRNERAGVKFNDMELIGAYTRITIGKALVDNNVEINIINSDQKHIVPLNEINDFIKKIFSN